MGILTADTPRDTAIAWLFVVVQLVLLVAVLLLPPGDDWVLQAWAAELARIAQLIGTVLLVVALVQLGTSLTPLPTPLPSSTLRTGGVYRIARHPIYTGILLLAFGSAARSGNAVAVAVAVALALWFAAKARWEEHHLVARYPDYADYAARTGRFVPFVGRRRAPGPPP